MTFSTLISSLTTKRIDIISAANYTSFAEMKGMTIGQGEVAHSLRELRG